MNSITSRTETEALLLEKLQSLLADLDNAGDNAQYGHDLNAVFDSWGRSPLSTRSKISD